MPEVPGTDPWGESLIVRIDRVYDLVEGEPVCVQMVWDSPSGREQAMWLPGSVSHWAVADGINTLVARWLISGPSAARTWASAWGVTVRKQ